MRSNRTTTLLAAAALAGSFGLIAPAGLAAETKSPLTAPVTQWTPDGVATYVQPDDPALVASVPPPPPPVAHKPDPAQVRMITELMDRCLTALSEKTSDADTQYYENGMWHFTPMVYSCDAGPGGMAAVLWKYRQKHPETMDAAAKKRQDWLYKVAVETMEYGIKQHGPNGRLTNPGSHDVFWSIEFANTYLLLKDTFDEPTRQRWQDIMRREISALQESGDMPNPSKEGWKGTDGWYTNGNVDVCHAANVYLVWLATGEQKYKDLFETCWKHTLAPNQERWKGYGLYFLKMPTKADGSDGSGYITEAAAKPGFDKGYGSMQLSIAARLYLKSRDPRALRVTNLLCNSELPHVDHDTMILDATYGSRHSEFVTMMTSGLKVLAWVGGRSDLLPMLPDVIQKADIPYFTSAATKNSNDPSAYRSCGFDLEVTLEAAMASE